VTACSPSPVEQETLLDRFGVAGESAMREVIRAELGPGWSLHWWQTWPCCDRTDCDGEGCEAYHVRSSFRAVRPMRCRVAATCEVQP